MVGEKQSSKVDTWSSVAAGRGRAERKQNGHRLRLWRRLGTQAPLVWVLWRHKEEQWEENLRI